MYNLDSCQSSARQTQNNVPNEYTIAQSKTAATIPLPRYTHPCINLHQTHTATAANPCGTPNHCSLPPTPQHYALENTHTMSHGETSADNLPSSSYTSPHQTTPTATANAHGTLDCHIPSLTTLPGAIEYDNSDVYPFYLWIHGTYPCLQNLRSEHQPIRWRVHGIDATKHDK